MKYKVCFLGVCIAIASALAITTSQFNHSQPSDFKGGTFQQTVVSSVGDLRLSRSTQRLIGEDARFGVIHAVLPLDDGSILLGTGPEAAVVRVAGGKAADIFKTPDAVMCTSLALAKDGSILAGFSGESAFVYRVDLVTGKGEKIYSADDLQFIWGICPMMDGSILLATGPTGKLVKIGADGKTGVLLATKQHNIVCITKINDHEVVLGTDPDGLVIKVDTRNGEWFVLYDADEPEITAIVPDAMGNLYVAGSTETEPNAEADPTTPAGRGEMAPEFPLRKEPPPPPTPPQLPDPTPGEPAPIPKTPLGMMSPVADNTRAIYCAVEEVAGPASHPAKPTTAPAPIIPTPAAETPNNGSAIYRIAKAGAVSEVFREKVTIYSLLMQDDSLVIGTGPEGIVYELRPVAQEKAEIVRCESRQVSAMAADKDGRVLLGLSNPDGLLRMDKGYAARGTYTSEVLDASQVATFGKLQLQGTMGNGCSMSISTRSGNMKDPEAGGWSKWSEEVPAAQFLTINSPPARFLQYRLTMGTNNPGNTPMLEQITLHYVLPNMPPRIDSLAVEPEAMETDGGKATASPPINIISWEATDPNGDELTFSIHYRMGYLGKWILLKDKVKETTFKWNTRQIADGRYQIRVTASDAASNADGAMEVSRFSKPVTIDNTPPVIGDIKSRVAGSNAEISLRVTDRTSIVSAVEYAVDSHDDWQGVTSSDMLYDSPDEMVKFVVKELAAGPHQVTIRANDSKGNTAFETLVVTVEEKK